MITKKLLTCLTFVTLILVAGCKTDDTFDQIIGECPIVISTTPENEAIDVSLNANITVTFNEAMNPLTITEESITLSNSTSEVAGIVTYNGVTATFTPTSLLEVNTTYTGNVNTSVLDTDGNALQIAHIWTFTTGTTIAPTVISTDPENLETSVALNKIITATFSEVMNPLTITETSFIVTENGNTVEGDVSYLGTTATFTPSSDLLLNTTYRATITTDSQNLTGTALSSDYVWTFSTGANIGPSVVATTPEDLETSVALNTVITATFSELMNPLTITDTSFIVTENGNTVDGDVTFLGVTATFTPSSNLLSETTYTATITTASENLAGTALSNDYVWTFSTSDTLGPDTINLDCVEGFAIIAGSTVTNIGPTNVDGDLGLSPGTAVTGFPPGTVTNGEIRINDTEANEAKDCLTAAYIDAAGQSLNVIVMANGELGGLTLAPGLYRAPGGSFDITSVDLTLDAQGDVNAVWVFQMPSSTLTVGNGVKVTLAGGASAANIYWQVGTSATIGTTAEMKGTIMADQSITLQNGAELIGRALAMTGAVTLENNMVILPN